MRGRVAVDVLRELGAGLVDLVFPPRCLTCDALADPFCAGCRSEIAAVEPGAPVPAGVADVLSAGYHEKALRKAVLRLKFGRKTALSAPLGALLAGELAKVRETWRPDALTPVPIHWTRQLERGYNQAELLADAVSRELHLPLLPALTRVRRTRHQVGLSREERVANPKGTFAAVSRIPVKGLRIVLVDDVRTTGATLSECASVLRTAGAAETYAVTVTFDV